MDKDVITNEIKRNNKHRYKRIGGESVILTILRAILYFVSGALNY
jgi:protoheme ferro-lyase